MASVASSPGSDEFESAVGEPIVAVLNVNKSVVWRRPERMSCAHNRELQIKCGAEAGLCATCPVYTTTTSTMMISFQAHRYDCTSKSDSTMKGKGPRWQKNMNTFCMPGNTGATMPASIKHDQPYPRALTYTLLLFASHFFTQSKWTRSSLQVVTPEATRSQ